MPGPAPGALLAVAPPPKVVQPQAIPPLPPPAVLSTSQNPCTTRAKLEPSTRTLRSQGLAPFVLLPENTWNQTPASLRKEKPSATTAQCPVEPSLTQKLWNTGWSAFGRLLPGGADKEPTDIHKMDAVPQRPKRSSPDMRISYPSFSPGQLTQPRTAP